MTSFWSTVRVSLLLLLAAAAAWAQGTAQISGTVSDASGAAVPDAMVKATQTDTGVSRTVTSGADGGYVLNNLQVGPYKLEVSKMGFATFVQTGIVLAVADSPAIPITLKVGAVSEQVEVQANAEQVETQNTGVSQEIETTRILELPLNGRNPADLIQLAGAAVLGAANSSRSMQGVLGGEGYSIAGGQPSGTTFLLDGALHENAYDNLNMPLPFPDALQEFKLETSALQADTGMHGGGTITAVTRSGTNSYHGDAFEFLRNNDLDATNPFAAINPSTVGTQGAANKGVRLTDGLKRNQFGATAGGPIKKNKIFFFGGYEGTTTRQLPASNIEYIPNATMLTGNLQAFAAPACNAGKQYNLGAPYVNNIAPMSALNPAALKIASTLPSTSDPCGQITFQSAIHQNEYQLVGKGDYHISDSNSMYVRYIATSEIQTPPYAIIPDILVTSTGGRDNLTQSAAIGDTYLFGSNKVNSFHVSMNRVAIHRTDKGFYDAQSVGINSYSYLPDYLQLTMSGGGSFSIGGGTESESTFHTDTYEVGDDFSIVKGAHQFAFGTRLAHWISSSNANVRSTGIFEFVGTPSAPSTGMGMADFLIGNMALLDDAEPNTLFMGQWSTGFYAQDRWKLRPNLTMNIGLRYEPWFPQSINNKEVYTFSVQRFLSDTVSKTFPNAPPGLYFPGDPGFIGLSGSNNHLGDVEPRIGIAWDPFSDGKMSVRASYGLFYDFPNGQFFLNSTIAPPFGDELRQAFPAGGLTNPWLGYPGGDPFPAASLNPDLFPSTAPYLPVVPNMPATEMHSWNLAVQRQFGANWLFSISYVGNETEHLWVSTQGNPSVYIPGTCAAGQYGLTAPGNCSSTANYAQRRYLYLLNPVLGANLQGYVDNYDPGATQSYNGAIFSIQHRLAHGFTIIANDTWSHCIAINGTNEAGTQNVAVGYVNPNYRNMDRGDCAYDRRQNLNISATYTTPSYGNRALRLVASGWTGSLIWRYLTGGPITSGTSDQLLNDDSSERAKQVLPSVYGTGFTTGFLNPAAFAAPATGTYGNMGVADIRGPGVPEIDAAVYRTFKIWESVTMQFRGEAFNIPNDFLRNNPSASTTSSQLGNITSAGNPRILQFSLKVVF